MNDLTAQAAELPAYVAAKLQDVAGRHRRALELAVAKGVRIAAGCDMFVSGRSYGSNGQEVGLLVAAGMTPLEAIAAATDVAPQTLGPQARRSGRLAAGFDADIITLDGDPVADPSVLGDPSRIGSVWIAGSAR